ncbi:MAG: hypothetical protein K1V88_08610 [Muribaculaceae bacterium]
MNKDFMYGIGAVKYKGSPVGYIAKNSFDMGGVKPEAAEIEAEQVPGAPVLVIAQSNGKIAPKFDMIQLNFESLHQMLGGTIHKEGEKVVGWTAPRDAVVMEGPWELSLVSGQSILIPSATLLSDLAGKLTLTETAKIEVELKVTAPTTEGVPPYGVFATASLPTEWSESKGWLLPKTVTDAPAAG